MTFEQFDKHCQETIQECLKMRDTKGKEYARSVDRFDNFNRLAATLGLKREQVLWVYAAKHLDGIISYVNNGKAFSDERVHGRIVDAITYLLLLDGMLAENDDRDRDKAELEVVKQWADNMPDSVEIGVKPQEGHKP